MTAPLLRCPACGRAAPANPHDWRCSRCASALELAERGGFDRSQIDPSRPGMWRYRRAIPIDAANPVTLNEPMTPLVPMNVAGTPLLGKLDGLLPTGSFKDRGMSVLVTFLTQQGVEQVIEDSSGNAAASIAGYAARAGISCTVYAPATASPGKLVQATAYGADVRTVTGTRDDVARAAETAAEKPGASYATHNWHPLFIEGVKTWAFEVWEQLGFEAPDAIIAPAGSGSAILGAWLAFSELLTAGAIARMPRIFAAQAAACAPLVVALESGADETTPFSRTPSIAEGIMIANPVRSGALLHALRASDGGAVAISEPEIRSALLEAARQGIYVEPTSATAFATAGKLLERGDITQTNRIVLLMTGNGLKATSAIGELLTAGF
jgi:threonine synthase